MNCPKCGRLAGQIDHADTPNKEIYRERYCTSCKHRFYTIEFEVENTPSFRKEWNALRKNKPKTRLVKDYGIR